VTSLEVPPDAAANFAPDRCGSCTRCIDACPTGALGRSGVADQPREMDAAKCIAYLTIEKKGSISEDLRAPMGRQVFGCDICQEVCPWNRKAPIGFQTLAHQGMETRRELVNPALDWLAAMDAKAFRRWFKGSPLERTGHKRLRRNVAIAMGNSGETRFLPQLEAWCSEAEDQALRETAAWAKSQIMSRSGRDSGHDSSES